MDLRGRDKDIYEFVKRFMLANGYTPSMREIGEGLGMASTATVHEHFERLVSSGYITKHEKRYSVKGMRYVEEGQEEMSVLS